MSTNQTFCFYHGGGGGDCGAAAEAPYSGREEVVETARLPAPVRKHTLRHHNQQRQQPAAEGIRRRQRGPAPPSVSDAQGALYVSRGDTNREGFGSAGKGGGKEDVVCACRAQAHAHEVTPRNERARRLQQPGSATTAAVSAAAATAAAAAAAAIANTDANAPDSAATATMHWPSCFCP